MSGDAVSLYFEKKIFLIILIDTNKRLFKSSYLTILSQVMYAVYCIVLLVQLK